MRRVSEPMSSSLPHGTRPLSNAWPSSSGTTRAPRADEIQQPSPRGMTRRWCGSSSSASGTDTVASGARPTTA
jgi:hypothetical protein